MKGKPWPKATLRAMRRRYPHEPTAVIAADLGMTVTACYQLAQSLGLKKTQEYLNGPHACRLRRDDNPGMGTRFQPGLVPHNKGVKGWQAGGRARETQFKKGSNPHNTVPIGSYRLEHGTGIRSRDARQTRHTYATLMLLAGAKPAFVSRQMGHANSQMFFKTYSKWLDSDDDWREVSKLNVTSSVTKRRKPA